MLSVYDKSFGVQYFFNREIAYTAIVTDRENVQGFIDFYDHIFFDDSIAMKVLKAINNYKISPDFFILATMEIGKLKEVVNCRSATQLITFYCQR